MSGQIIAAVHVLFVAPLLSYIGYWGKKTPNWIFTLLLVLGITVGIWHLANWVKYAKRSGAYGEGFSSSYLGIPYNWQTDYVPQHSVRSKNSIDGAEGFIGMPFSFPYHDESTHYNSYHDKVNTRECDGAHCHHQIEDLKKANIISKVTGKEGFVVPSNNDDYGMLTVTPYNHNNPKFHGPESARFYGDKNMKMSKHVCTGSPNCDECCYSIRGNKTSPEYKHCMSGCVPGK